MDDRRLVLDGLRDVDGFWVAMATYWAVTAAYALVVAGALLALHGRVVLAAAAFSLGSGSLVAIAVRWWPP